MTKTLDQIADLARAYFAAKEAHLAAYKAEPKATPHDSEEYIRWEIQSRRLCSAVVTTGNTYREACDEFFAKSASDLIQLLVDVDEYFDGREDADDGIPNTAMKCRQQIETFLGPVPVSENGL